MSRDQIKLMEREYTTKEFDWNDSELSDDLINQMLCEYCNAVDKDDLDDETREEFQIIYREPKRWFNQHMPIYISDDDLKNIQDLLHYNDESYHGIIWDDTLEVITITHIESKGIHDLTIYIHIQLYVCLYIYGYIYIYICLYIYIYL